MMFALYGDPQLRLLDECSTGLDPASRLAMIDTLKSSRAGTTIFTTHSMSEAEDLCTKAVIMSRGKVLEFDLVGKMRSRHFDCCWVQVELQQEQGWSGVREEVEREGVAVSGEGTMMRLQIDKKMIRKSYLLRQMIALKEQRKILNFSWIEPRLEDVYL
jgi:ABC-type multidrug transport system ATPase subunit